MNVNLIIAVDRNCYGIGYKNTIPWHNKNDMKWFKDVTIGSGNNAVIMGLNTYNSIGKPLPNRINIVLTHKDILIPNVIVYHSLEDAIKYANLSKCDSAFIIGGCQTYMEALKKDIVDIMYIDYLNTGLSENDFDTFLNPFDISYDTRNFIKSDILTDMYKDIENTDIQVFYNKRTNCTTDYEYLKLMYDIIKNGKTKHTRAGETLSVFGKMLTFDLRHSLPILTTKRVYSKGCIHELLWILHGDTNIKYLIDNNTHIWDDDAYRFYLQKFESDKEVKMDKDTFLNKVKNQEKINVNDETYTFGDLGPVYGKQWVDWKGINQVKELIYKLKNNPDDRRLMISAWNVGEISDMALPPCHYMSQFYTTEMTHIERCVEYYKRHNIDIIPKEGLYQEVSDEELDKENIPTKYLSCMWMQRSVDTCLGLPYDLLSYSILTHLIANICNMVPLELKCSLGDTHIYKNQLEGAIKQIQRNPFKYEPATLDINRDIKNINDYSFYDIRIKGYSFYSTIKYILSVGL